jgi:RNA polymerase sigma-70 factor (ECF subfamily)
LDFAGSVADRLDLVEALRSLPRRQRETVALRFLADLSEADVAAALGISENTVGVHVHRGLQALRVQLAGTRESEVIANG